MNKVFISTASIAITILLYYLGARGDHTINFITTAPQNVTYNYEKYGKLVEKVESVYMQPTAFSKFK